MERFENDISILLKRAKELDIPSKFVKISDNKYTNMIEEINTLILAGKNLPELYKIFETITPEDLIMRYSLKEEDSLLKINNFYKSLGLDKIRNKQELLLLRRTWFKKLEEEKSYEMEKLESIEQIQGELLRYKELEYSPIKINSTIIFAQMQMKNGETPTLNDGYEIFDLSVPKEELPYLRWNTTLEKNREVIKLYKGKTLENRPEYSKIIPSISLKEIPNTLNFSVLKADGNSYLKGTYSLEKNLMKIKVPTESNKEKVLKNITNSLALDIVSMDENSISGDLYIFDIEINDLLLSHMVLNDDTFSNYFFMKDMSTPFALKKQLKLFYRSLSGLDLEDDQKPSSVSFNITQNYAKGGEIVNVLKDGIETEKILEEKEPYIRINISSAESLKIAQDFVKIFSTLLTRYKENEEYFKDFYISYIPEFKNYEEDVTCVRKIGKDGNDNSKSRILKQVAPELFIAGYPRKCPCEQQPLSIPEDQIDQWKKTTFEHKNEILKRQVLSLPPNDPKYHFVCPDDKFPFPGVKTNKLENKDLFPGLPCCFKEDHMESKSSKYSKIFKEGIIESIKPDITPKESESHTIKSDKILKIGRYGTVPSSINDLLKTDPTITEIRRKGVPRSVNSLLHCLSIAIDDEKYIKSKDKEKYISYLRLVISDKIHPSLCKQEMYDFTNDEILYSLKDQKSFLDPNLYYRAIEKTYGINLFVFAPSSDEEKRLKNKEGSKGVIELPRFKLFYSRTPSPDLPTILIYRTMGSESDNLSYPQCELLISYEDEIEKKFFDKTIYSIVYNALLSVNNTITWELVSDNGDIDIIARNNLYSRINFHELTNKIATKQYIDEFGKLRGLYLNDEILMVFPSSSPENLPDSKKVTRASIDNVLSIFKSPVAVSINSKGLVDGLWFSVLDLVYGIYFPIIPVKKEGITKDLPTGPTNPLGENGTEVVPRLRKIKRDLNFILQSLKWLLALSKMELKDFMNKYTGIGNITGNSSNIYDFKNIGRKFPDVNTVEEGIVEMRKRVPTLFSGDRLFLYSEKMFNGVLYLMEMYVKEYVKNIKNMTVPKTINREKLVDEDFIDYTGVVLFLNEIDLKTWLGSLNKYPEIINKLTIGNALKNEPYMYISPDNHIYLIQNVTEGNIERALNISYYWRKYKVNIGFKSPEYDELEQPKYVVYEISQANQIEPVENNADESIDFYSILRYNKTSHAAMLRLL